MQDEISTNLNEGNKKGKDWVLGMAVEYDTPPYSEIHFPSAEGQKYLVFRE
jgi:hypothetical protein